MDPSEWILSREQMVSREQALRIIKDHGTREKFTLGPIPHSVIAGTRAVHKDALAVLLAIKAARDINIALGKGEEVAVTQAICDQIGVPKLARIRAVRALEAAGVLTVTRSSNRAPRVKLAPGLFKLKPLEFGR